MVITMLFIDIPSYNWLKIEKKAKSLAKYGCEAKLVKVYQTKKGEACSVEIAIPENLEAGKWEFMGIKKEYGEDVLYFGNIPEKYRNTSMYCEHCNSSRYRKSVMIIKDEETGKILQVGKSCVKKYLGDAFSMLGGLLLTIDEILDEEEKDFYEGGFSLWESYLDKYAYLYYCLEDIKERGYIKANTYDYNNKPVPPTSFIASEAYSKATEEELSNIINSAEIKAEIDEAIEAYNAFVAKQGESEFSHNVQVLLAGNYIKSEYKNMIAFVPQFLIKKREFEAIKKAKEEKAEEFNSQLAGKYAGQEKEKVSFKVKLIHHRVFESMYGYDQYVNCYTFISEEGYLLQWKTQTYIGEKLGFNSHEEMIKKGAIFSLTGTVKENKEFKGRFYTVLTRCKVA